MVTITIILAAASLLMGLTYILYMFQKNKQYPVFNFSRFKIGNITDEQIAAMEASTRMAYKGVNGWLWLATVYTSANYLIHFWTITCALLNILIIAYRSPEDPTVNQNLILSFTSIDIILTCADLWIDTKSKSKIYNEQWFSTSALAKKYISKISLCADYESLCKTVEVFHSELYELNKHISFP